MTATVGASEVTPVEPRRARPVLWWASAGAVAVLFQVYLYGRWVLSDDFESSPKGPDPVPTWEKVFAWILQPTLTLGAILVAAWVIRGCVKAGRLTFDAKLTIAWYSIVWLDPRSRRRPRPSSAPWPSSASRTSRWRCTPSPASG